MKIGLPALVLALCTVSVSSTAAAKDAPGLAPSTPWTLDYDTDSCALRRMFGTGEKQAYLEFRRFQPGLGLQALIASSWMKPRKMPAKFEYRFGDESDWRETDNALSVTTSNGFGGVIFNPAFVNLAEYAEIEDPLERAAYRMANDLRAVEQASAAEIDAITLRHAFRNELRLELGSLDAPIAALNKCVDELMTHWGIDAEAHKSLARPAIPTNLPEVPSMMAYPPKMLRQFMPGLVNVRLEIDERGLITACHIQMPLSDPAFEESSCADIQHALEFDPALDKDGNPIDSYWVTQVHFRIR